MSERLFRLSRPGLVLFVMMPLLAGACASKPKDPTQPKGANKMLSFGSGVMNSAVGSSIPAIDAMLPYDTDREPGEATEIDGYWRLDANKRLYRIDRGRVIADQDYPAFPFMVRRGMVVTQDVVVYEDGSYVGKDLGSKGEWRATLAEDGSLGIVIHTLLGKVHMRMVRSDLGTGMASGGR